MKRTLPDHVEAKDVEHLTDAELAMQVYLAIIRHDDALSDSVMELFRPAWTMAAVLHGRLKGPYCEVIGCRNEHMEHFPFCAWHRPEHFGPLPDDFPANPNPMDGAA